MARKYNFYQKTYKHYPDLTLKKAYEIGQEIGVDFSIFDLGEFRQGIKEEMEHGSLYSEASGGITKVHEDSYATAGRIAIAHLLEVPDYYQRLEDLEGDSDETWSEDEEEKAKRTKAWIAQNYQEEADALKAENINLP